MRRCHRLRRCQARHLGPLRQHAPAELRSIDAQQSSVISRVLEVDSTRMQTSVAWLDLPAGRQINPRSVVGQPQERAARDSSEENISLATRWGMI